MIIVHHRERTVQLAYLDVTMMYYSEATLESAILLLTDCPK